LTEDNKNTENTLETEEQARKEVSSDLDDLLADPFEKLDSSSAEQSTVPQDSNDEEQTKRTYESLPEESKKQADQLAEKIDDTDIDSVLNYGAAAQQKIGDFSHNVLNHVQTQDTGRIGETLNDLMYQLKESNPDDLRAEDSNIFKRIFKKINRSIYETTAKYQKIGAQVDKIAGKLDKEKDTLLNDNQMLNELYDKNLDYYKALNVYIGAGEVRLDTLINETIPEASKTAEQATDQMPVQRVNDLNQFQNRLEKRVHDLKIARQLTIQQAPQIRLIQNTNQALAEKIQTSINTAIPLWKNQVVIALTLLRQKEAITAQRQVSETTNEMLTKNSELLKQSSIETAKENERSVVDIETLEKTQTDLLDTLEETISIQREGRTKRKDAEQRLTTMEGRLQDQLLELTDGSNTNN